MLQKLQNILAADLRKLGIKRQVTFPSGALLVTCESATKVDQLRQITSTAGIKEKIRKENAPKFWVHTIPKNTTVEQVKDLTRRFAGTKFHVELHPYHSEKYKDQFFAAVRTSLEDLKNVAKARYIRVG